MAVGTEAMMRVHLSAFNGQDPDSLMGLYANNSVAIRDGRLVAEGHNAIRNLLHEEAANGSVVGQMVQLDGEPAIIQWSGPEGHRVRSGIVQVRMAGDRVREIRIEHREKALQRLAAQ